MRRRRVSTLLGTVLPLLAGWAGLLAPSGARAVSPVAQTLFEEGRRLLLAGRVAEACPILRKSLAIDASSGTLLNLALCDERMGRTASAFEEYGRAAELARLQAREDRATVAEERRESLRPRLARVTVRAPDAPPGAILECDDGPLEGTRLDQQLALNPGLRRLTVSAPRHRSWTTSIELHEGEDLVVEVPSLPAFEREVGAGAQGQDPQQSSPPRVPERPARLPQPDVRLLSFVGGPATVAVGGTGAASEIA